MPFTDAARSVQELQEAVLLVLNAGKEELMRLGAMKGEHLPDAGPCTPVGGEVPTGALVPPTLRTALARV
jgi:hypothetical protein